jgi:hypothetical protein
MRLLHVDFEGISAVADARIDSAPSADYIFVNRSAGELKALSGLSVPSGILSRKSLHEKDNSSGCDGGDGCGDRDGPAGGAGSGFLRGKHLLCDARGRKPHQQILRLHGMERLAAARRVGLLAG